MRKTMMTLAAVLCCAMTMTVFTACGSDDEKKSDEKTPVACGMSYMLSVGTELFKYVDFTIEYYDKDGNVQSEQMEHELWEKTVETKLPGKVGVQVKLKMKDGADPSDIETFTVNYTYRYQTYTLAADGKKTSGDTSAASPTRPLKGSDIPRWVEENPVLKSASFGYSFDANGKFTNIGF